MAIRETMKLKIIIAPLLLCIAAHSYASSLLVPSLKEEVWLQGPKSSLPTKKYETPFEEAAQYPDIPDNSELIINETVFIPVEERENNNTGLNPDDILSSGPALEPTLRAAIERDQAGIAEDTTQDNVFTQTDIFFSLTWDYSTQELSQDNKNIAEQIIASAKRGQNMVFVTIPQESTGAMAAKTNEFLQYIKAAGITDNQISVSITSNENAAMLQENTILVTIKQKQQEQ